MTLDLSTWLTKQEAADRLGVSTKAIERFTRAGKLEQRFRPQAGSPHVAVYFPDDVAQLAQARQRMPVPFVLAASTDRPTNGNGHHAGEALDRVTTPVIPGDDLLRPGDNLLRVLVTAAARVMSETSQTPTAAYVTRAEALAIAGVSAGELRRAVQAGEVKVRGRRYRRQDLEAL
jgi:hypothetical protein